MIKLSLSLPNMSFKAGDEVLKGPIKSKTLFPVLILHLLDLQPDHGFGLMQRVERQRPCERHPLLLSA